MDIWKLDLRLESLASVYAFATLGSGAHGGPLSLVLDRGWPISLTALSRPQYVVANLTRRVCPDLGRIRGARDLCRATGSKAAEDNTLCSKVVGKQRVPQHTSCTCRCQS
jgi:hypothetical protein